MNNPSGGRGMKPSAYSTNLQDLTKVANGKEGFGRSPMTLATLLAIWIYICYTCYPSGVSVHLPSANSVTGDHVNKIRLFRCYFIYRDVMQPSCQLITTKTTTRGSCGDLPNYIINPHYYI